MNIKREYKKRGWQLLNERPALECEDEEAFDAHVLETARVMEDAQNRAVRAGGAWMVRRHHIDRAHESAEPQHRIVHPYGITELLEGADFKNGIDATLADDGKTLVFIAYGQGYTDCPTGETGVVAEAFECRLLEGDRSDTAKALMEDGWGELVPDDLVCDLQRREEAMLREYGWTVHYVYGNHGELNGLANIHTHGLQERFRHLDFQVVLPVASETVHPVLSLLAEQVKNGRVFKPYERYDCVLAGMEVKFLPYREGDRTVLRLLLPDPTGKLPDEEGCDSAYARQLDSLPEKP